MQFQVRFFFPLLINLIAFSLNEIGLNYCEFTSKASMGYYHLVIFNWIYCKAMFLVSTSSKTQLSQTVCKCTSCHLKECLCVFWKQLQVRAIRRCFHWITLCQPAADTFRVCLQSESLQIYLNKERSQQLNTKWVHALLTASSNLFSSTLDVSA